MLPETAREQLRTLLTTKPENHAVPNIQILDPLTDNKLQNGRYPYQEIVANNIDRMQKETCNILVASPTGSGKTFAIEYAVNCITDTGHTICIAEPLIALTEQIYATLRGLVEEKELMLRTGPIVKGDIDVARVLVCTYEVLARIAFEHTVFFERCKTVIIDEIHCIESERGPVLLEILNECQGRNLIALSGTLPNKKEFANFIASVNGYSTIVTGAKTRPVPLTYCHYNVGRQKCSLLDMSKEVSLNADLIGGITNKQDLLSCIRCLMSYESQPMLFVLFSVRRLEQMAEWASCMDFLNSSEKSRVSIMFNAMLRSIPEEDHVIFHNLYTLARNGIGLHHSHLPVPYLELVCALAVKRLLRVVFCSSTLSKGINLPVRTVIVCGAYIPQKQSDGKVSHEILSPLLFHQLAGRAGRPQFENNGYVVIVGKNDDSYYSAIALAKRPLPNVTPYTVMNQGDVIRGVRQRRNLGLEQAFFTNPSVRSMTKFSFETKLAVDRIVQNHTTQEQWQEALQVSKAVKTVLENPTCLAYVKVLHPEEFALVFDPVGHVSVVLSAALHSTFLCKHVITTSRPNRKYPGLYLNTLLETREAVEQIFMARDRDADFWLLVSVALFQQTLESSHINIDEASEFEKIFGEVPQTFKESENTLNHIGLAACEIRAVQNPCLVFDAFLADANIDCDHILHFCSAVLAEGKCDPEINDHTNTLRKFPSLNSFPYLTEAKLTLAVLDWAQGSTLHSIVSKSDSCSVGVICRHLLRVSDLLQELRDAVGVLEITQVILNIDQAKSKIMRGLPFIKRGTGRIV